MNQHIHMDYIIIFVCFMTVLLMGLNVLDKKTATFDELLSVN